MKKVIFLILLSQTLYAQKIYEFDYCIELDIDLLLTKKKLNHYYFINSKKPNYTFYIPNLNKDSLSLNFKDINGIKIFNSKIERSSFFNTLNIKFDCYVVGEETNYYEFKTKEYEVNQLKDTLIDGKYLFHVEIKSKKSLKYQKRKKIGKTYLIIEKNSNYIPSYLVKDALIYNLWKKSSLNIIGRIISAYDLDFENNIVATYKYNYIKVNKNIIIPEECDFTLNKNKLKNKFKTLK